MSLTPSEKNIVTFPQGAIIAREGEPGGDLLIIRSGVAEVFRVRNGKELILARVGTGEILGVMTVTNGGPRAASVRAKTAVTAVKVEKERIKELMDSVPKWAVSLINDLVMRVTQTNELYEKSAAASDAVPVGGRNLTMAVQVANGFVPLAETLAASSSDKTISVDEILEKLSQIVNEPFKDLRKIIDVFDAKELVPWRGGSSHSRCAIGELDHFTFFAKFVKDNRSNGRLEDLISAFGVKERKLLRAVVEIGEKRLGEKQNQVTVTFKDLEEALRFMGHKFDPHMIKEADHHKLLQQSKTGEDLTAIFSPRDLKLTILSIECVIAFDQFEEGSQKLARRRSLVY